MHRYSPYKPEITPDPELGSLRALLLRQKVVSTMEEASESPCGGQVQDHKCTHAGLSSAIQGESRKCAVIHIYR